MISLAMEGLSPKFTFWIPTEWRTFSFLLRWNVSRSQSWAVSVEHVMAYLPEPWTEMEETEESCPLIQLTSSLVAVEVRNRGWERTKLTEKEPGDFKRFQTQKKCDFGGDCANLSRNGPVLIWPLQKSSKPGIEQLELEIGKCVLFLLWTSGFLFCTNLSGFAQT